MMARPGTTLQQLIRKGTYVVEEVKPLYPIPLPFRLFSHWGYVA